MHHIYKYVFGWFTHNVQLRECLWTMSQVTGTILIPLIIWLLYLDTLCLNSGLHSRLNECLGGSVA